MFTEPPGMSDMVNEARLSDRRAALRDDLIAAATRAMSEGGYQALRARDLAREVGCALGAIYGVFPDLDALVIAVKARTLADLDAEIAARFAAWKAKAAPARSDPREGARQALLLLAEAYLAFASEHPGRWRALFEHRALDASVPEAYASQLEGVLGHIERPLATIAPAASPTARRLFARTLFSAVHGVVALGLDEKLGPLPAAQLAWQVRTLVEAAAAGMIDHPEVVSAAPP
jgi:AcrR family transcriptional regulator